MKNWLRKHSNDTLFQNTFLLVLSRVLATGFGYLFWVLAARTMAADNVGLASGGISSASLLAGFAHLGLGYGIIRRLAHADDPHDLINYSISAASLAALALALVFIGGIKLWSPELVPLTKTFYTILLFVLMVVSFTLSRIIFSVFLATRQLLYGLLKQAVQSILGVVLLFALRGAMSGYVAALSAYSLASVLSIILALPFLSAALPGYRLAFTLRYQAASSLNRYSFINYLCDQVQFAPATLLPVIVLNILGAEAGAYFYIPWSVGRGLVTLASSASESLFSEGSHDPEMARSYTRRSARMVSLLTMAMAAVVILGGRLILSLYGAAYVANSLALLYAVAAAVIPEALILVAISYQRIRDHLGNVFALLSASSLGGIACSLVGMTLLGLSGAGVGWLVTQAVVLMALAVWQHLRRTRPRYHAEPGADPSRITPVI